MFCLHPEDWNRSRRSITDGAHTVHLQATDTRVWSIFRRPTSPSPVLIRSSKVRSLIRWTPVHSLIRGRADLQPRRTESCPSTRRHLDRFRRVDFIQHIQLDLTFTLDTFHSHHDCWISPVRTGLREITTGANRFGPLLERLNRCGRSYLQRGTAESPTVVMGGGTVSSVKRQSTWMCG